MDLTSDFQTYHDQVTKSLVEVVRTGGQISNTDLSFHRSNDKVSRALDQQNSRLLRLTNKLLKAATQDSAIKTPTLRDQDGIEDNWRGVVDVIDDLLEKADASLDEFTGVIARLSPAHQDGAQTPSQQTSQSLRPSSRVHFPKVMHKPQMLFHTKVNNLTLEPFKPLLVNKPYAIKSLQESVGDGSEQYGHPYAEEISQYKYPQRVYEPSRPVPYSPPEHSTAVFVDTEQGVQDMLQELKTAQEIAVDLEHHEYRSYYGIVSLMQISTRNKDWIVDTLKPWREKLQVLNEVFADPNILKIFHGSSMDVIWLQRDLGLYVVGLFDTYYACEALQFPGRGLKYLLQRFANFEAQKQYQMADWRVRPLPAELIDYARSDTHYLLYIYDILRNMLIEQSTPQIDLVDHVFQGSKKEASQVYIRFTYDKESGRGSHGWYNLFTDYSNRLNEQQFAVFRALHAWRDTKAREEDEGVSYIFSNKVLWTLAEHMPTNHTHLYGTQLRPMPSAVTQHASKIFELVHKAKEEAATEPPVHEFIRLNQEKYGVPQNRWKKFKEEKSKSQLTGVGATLQQLTQNGEVGSGTTTPEVKPSLLKLANTKPAEPVINRAQRSSLWGRITTAMSVVSLSTDAAITALQTVLPLPKLSHDTFAKSNSVHTPSPIIEQPPTRVSQQDLVPTAESPKQVNNVFTLQQQSRKRKADELEFPDHEPQSYVNLTHSAPASAQSTTNSEAFPTSPGTPTTTKPVNPEHQAKRLAKQQRKAEKQSRKAAREAEAAATAAAMVPFDYTNADRLIDATPDVGSRGRSPPADRPGKAGDRPFLEKGRSLGQGKKAGDATAGKGKGKGKGSPMNPFAKGLDTGTGAKRNKMGKELGGRSMTFQS